MSDKSFEECCSIAQEHRDQLKHESWYPQHMWITQQTDGRYRVMVDLVLRLENLAEDFAILCNRLGIPSIEPPLINASQRGHYRSYYNDDTASIIADVYSVDIELLGYKF